MRIKFLLQPATIDDFDFLFDLNRITMYDHVVQTWGTWDEVWQKNYFKEKFNPSEYSIIVVCGQRAGTVAIMRDSQKIEVDRLQISPEFQNSGIGTAILNNLIMEAKKENKKLSLTVLKSNNRALSLYEQKGFKVVGENKERYFMQYAQGVN